MKRVTEQRLAEITSDLNTASLACFKALTTTFQTLAIDAEDLCANEDLVCSPMAASGALFATDGLVGMTCDEVVREKRGRGQATASRGFEQCIIR